MAPKKTSVISVDIYSGKVSGQFINFTTMDVNTASLSFQVKNQENKLALSNVTPKIFLNMEDGSQFVEDCEIVDATNGVVQYTLKSNEIKHSGRVDAEFYLVYTDSSIGSFNFTFYIKKSAIDTISVPAQEVAIIDMDTFKASLEARLDDTQATLTSVQQQVTDAQTQADTITNLINQNQVAKQSDVTSLTTQMAEKATKHAVTDFGCKGDGITDDTVALQNAINYCGANNLTLDLSNHTYYITSTLIIKKDSTMVHEYRIKCDKALIKTDKAIIMVKIQKRSNETYAQDWNISIDNLNLNGGRMATVGLYNDSEAVRINSLNIDGCITGYVAHDVYYCSFDGLNVINNCNTGIAITGTENNAVDYSRFWIIGGSRYDTVNSIGVDIQTRGLNLTLSDLTIEAYGTAIKQTAGSGQLILAIKNCYFEQITQSFINITGAGGLLTDNLVTIRNNHGNEIRSQLAQSAIQVGHGFFEILDNNFKDNVVEFTSVNTNVETDMPCFIYEAGSASGYQQSIKNVSRQRSSYNSLADFNSYNRHFIRNETYGTLNKVYPALTYMMRDITFDNGVGVILKAPNGTLYRLKVDNTGALSTAQVPNQGTSYVLPDYKTHNINTIKTMDLTRYKYNQIICEETNLTYNVTGGVTSYVGSSALGLKAFGNIAYIISALTSVITTQTWNSLFIYNTDINQFYNLQGNYWAYGGTVAWRDYTTTRAVGTTAQRPTGIASNFIYYDTDLSGYVKWNGSAWVTYTP